jgi:hypothetical protein
MALEYAFDGLVENIPAPGNLANWCSGMILAGASPGTIWNVLVHMRGMLGIAPAGAYAGAGGYLPCGLPAMMFHPTSGTFDHPTDGRVSPRQEYDEVSMPARRKLSGAAFSQGRLHTQPGDDVMPGGTGDVRRQLSSKDTALLSQPVPDALQRGGIIDGHQDIMMASLKARHQLSDEDTVLVGKALSEPEPDALQRGDDTIDVDQDMNLIKELSESAVLSDGSWSWVSQYWSRGTQS